MSSSALALQPSPASTVAIVTRDRPEKLDHSLRSHIAHAREYGRSFRLLVLDDSPDPSVGARNRAVALAAAATAGSISITYVGSSEKRSFAAALACRAGVDPAIIDFALFGWPQLPFRSGANTNAFLLQSAGERALCFDDDILCLAAAAPGRHAGWRLTSQGDPTDWEFFETEAESFRLADWEGEDVHAALSAPLGRTVAELIPSTGEVELSSVSAPWAAELRAGDTSARVLLSSTGLRGDSGMGNPAYLLKLRGAARDRLLSGDASRFARLLGSRQIGRSVSQPTLCEASHLQNYAIGADCRECLPPHLPLFRSSESFFSWTLGICWRRPLICHLPFQLRHEPPSRRRVDLASFTAEAGRTQLGHWYLAAVQMYHQRQGAGDPAADPEARMIAFGAMLCELCDLPRARALAAIGSWVRQQHERELAKCDALLAEYSGEPAYWAQHLTNYKASLQRHLGSVDFPAPETNPPQRLSPEHAAQQMLSLFSQYGRLLQHWPALVAAARALRQESRT